MSRLNTNGLSRALGSLDHNVRLVFIARSLSSTGFSSTMPFIAIYLAEQRSVPLYLVGLMYLISGALGFFSLVVSGIVSDRFGAKRTIVIGYGLSLAGAAYMSVAVAAHLNVYVIILTYPFLTLLRGVSVPSSAAIISEGKGDVVNRFSALTMASNLGFAVGPALGGVVAQAFGYAPLFGFSAVLMAACIPLGLALTDKKLPEYKRQAGLKPPVYVTAFLAIVFLSFIVVGQDIQPFALYAGVFDSVSNSLIGLMFAFSGLLIVALQLVVNLVFRKWGAYASLVSGSGVAAAGYYLLAASKAVPYLFLSMAVITLAEILVTVPTQVWIVANSPPERRGAYQGYYSAMRSGGRSVAAWLGSTDLGLFSQNPAYAWYVIVGLAVAGGLAYLGHLRFFGSGNQKSLTPHWQ